jgi:hypothetical protein
MAQMGNAFPVGSDCLLLVGLNPFTKLGSGGAVASAFLLLMGVVYVLFLSNIFDTVQ